ncbi:MAG: flagellar hook protein [Ruminococcus sp.]|nr:flagellar hook protein [Ruminococcus sp.]
MVVQHNLTAMNSNRMLNLTVKDQGKSTEKLSSGFKINRAADDAAGLSISEKMRKQIRGLTQASANAQDGISAVQTAEGALNEVQDMLQRMNELAVKAANGTNSTDDRTYIQNEIDQLVSEIDRVAETTKFNETYLLKGDKSQVAYKFNYVTYDADQATTSTMATTPATTGLTLGITYTNPAGDASLSEAANELAKVVKESGITVSTDGDANVSYTIAGYTVSSDGKVTKNGVQVATITKTGTAVASMSDTVKSTATTAGHAAGETVQYYDANGNKVPFNALTSYFTTDGTTITYDATKKLYNAAGDEVTPAPATEIESSTMTGDLLLKLHVGADATANNQIELKITALTADGIGIAGLRVDGADDKNALNAIDVVKEAIQKISTQRSALGAIQNRLDHTINNLDNVVENTTSAEASIRDTDMATEMVKYSNDNILAQAGQAMLAQANQSNQGVLSLLQ